MSDHDKILEIIRLKDQVPSTMLDQTLRNMGIQSLLVCVETMARDAADRGFQVIIAEDACTALSADLYRAALQAFSSALGRVRKTDDIVQLLGNVGGV